MTKNSIRWWSLPIFYFVAAVGLPRSPTLVNETAARFIAITLWTESQLITDDDHSFKELEDLKLTCCAISGNSLCFHDSDQYNIIIPIQVSYLSLALLQTCVTATLTPSLLHTKQTKILNNDPTPDPFQEPPKITPYLLSN